MITTQGARMITRKVSSMGSLRADVQVCAICALYCSLLLGIRPEFSIPVCLMDAFHDVGNGVREGELGHRHHPGVVLDPHQCLSNMIVQSVWGDLGFASICLLGMV